MCFVFVVKRGDEQEEEEEEEEEEALCCSCGAPLKLFPFVLNLSLLFFNRGRSLVFSILVQNAEDLSFVDKLAGGTISLRASIFLRPLQLIHLKG